MAGKTISIRIPAWTANLLPNLLGLAGLSAICLALAFLTDWRWGMGLGGVFATFLAVVMSFPAEAKPAAVTPIKKAS
jgi:hypothetical protein